MNVCLENESKRGMMLSSDVIDSTIIGIIVGCFGIFIGFTFCIMYKVLGFYPFIVYVLTLFLI